MGRSKPARRQSRPSAGKRQPPQVKQTFGRSPYSANPDRGAISTPWVRWSFIFLLVSIVSASLGATLALMTPYPSASKSDQRSLGEMLRSGLKYGIAQPTNILIMGIDRVPDAKEGSPESFASRSDTMLLTRVNPDDGSINILSIPRDTQVEVPGYGTTKINHANWKGGPELATEVVSQTFNGVPVDHYVRLSTGAFRELVNVVGGVRVYVPEPMYYNDETQDLHIDLEPGWQKLNGEQAEGFARFRNDQYGDIGRAQRQQILLKALQKRLTNPLLATRLPQVVNIIQKHVDTDLNLGEILGLIQFGLRLDSKDLKMVLLPGRFSGSEEFNASYWIMDLDGMDRVMRNYFDVSPFTYQLEGEAPLARSLRISVQNATDQPDGARQMADYLIQQGFENVYIENDWSRVEPQTAVIDQGGYLDAAKTVVSALGTGMVEADSTGNIDSDLTIRVGQDWIRQQADNPDRLF